MPYLTLYEPCIILQYVYKLISCTKFLWLDFIFNIRSTCFGLYQSIFRSNLFICCMSYLVSACTKYDIQHTSIKRLLLKMDWYSPKHVERILKIKSNYKRFVDLVGLCTYMSYCYKFSGRKTNKKLYVSQPRTILRTNKTEYSKKSE